MVGEVLTKDKTGILYVWDESSITPDYRPIASLTEKSLSSSLSVIERRSDF